MRSCKYLMIAIAVASLCAARICLGTGLPSLRMSELVSQSDVVVVADVSAIKSEGLAGISLGGIAIPAERYSAKIVTLYCLVDSCPERFSLEFVLPNTATGYRPVKSGARLLFLKKSGTVYKPTNPYYPDFPALRAVPSEFHGDVTALVFAELGAVIASANASPSDKWEVLTQSFVIPEGNTLFLNDLLVGLRSTADPELHRRVQAELISRNDISELGDVCDALAADGVSPTEKAVLLYVISQRLKNESAAPTLAQSLHSSDPQVRLASAQALWHIASPSSIGALTEALNDQSIDVRYYAIRGLAAATGELQWGPSPSEYEEHESKYRQHWLEWASQHEVPLSHN